MSKFTLDWKQYAALARQAAAEGCVLLENKNNTLPLAEGETCAVFGRTQFEYYKSGTGSGGLVNTSYVHDLDYALTESSLIIDEEVKDLYCSTNGRYSVDPVVLFKLVFIDTIDGLKSMRKTCEKIKVDAEYRWFLGIPFGQKTPHYSTFSQNYIRRFAGTDRWITRAGRCEVKK